MRVKRHLPVAVTLLMTLLTATTGRAEQPSEACYAAIRQGDLAKLESLLKAAGSANTPDDRGITPLMYAAVAGSPESMTLLIRNGADVDARNALGSTALIWSVSEPKKVRLLLEAGANVNVASNEGRTGLFVAAMSDNSADVVRLLLSKGADPRVVDRGKMTPLHAATVGGDTDTVRLLVDAGLDVNAVDVGGYTPLMNAAQNGNVAAVRLLLSRGASVYAVSGNADVQTHSNNRAKNGTLAQGEFTALALASAFGSPELVKTLIDAKSDVRAKDMRGLTPLMLAVASDHQTVEVIRLLLVSGADVNAKDLNGETALDWAVKIGAPDAIDLLKRAHGVRSVAAPREPRSPAPVALKAALQRSVDLLEKTSATFFVNGGCVSCHAQNITDMAIPKARSKGLRVDEAAAQSRSNQTRASIIGRGPVLLERIEGGGTPDVPLYSLAALASVGYAPDRGTDIMLANLAAQQLRDGRWRRVGLARPPIQDGDVLRTALAIRALKTFGAPGRSADLGDRLQRATVWLSAATPITGIDRSMQLLGLYWAGKSPDELQPLAKAIVATQRSDGGWAQRPGLASDAYATGQSLVALAETRTMEATAPAYQRGVKYLLSTQHGDGSWYVRSRATKFQPYFESGFPYGPDQWISSMATGWAALALGHATE